MGNRRSTRLIKPRANLAAGHGTTQSGSTWVTDPSGVTIGYAGISVAGGVGLNMTSGITCSKIDTGQGTQYKIFRGCTTLNTVSDGTQVITTGLTDCVTFIGTIMEYPNTATGVVFAVMRNVSGGVSCGFWYAQGGGVSVSNATSGISLHWIAMGT